MRKAIKGLLIDPENQTITEVDVFEDVERESHLESIYKHLQCKWVDVGRNCLSYLPGKPVDDLWFDDEGNFSDCPYMFQLPRLVPLIGRALILSYDEDGRSCSHTLTPDDIEELRATVTWGVRERS